MPKSGVGGEGVCFKISFATFNCSKWVSGEDNWPQLAPSPMKWYGEV